MVENYAVTRWFQGSSFYRGLGLLARSGDGWWRCHRSWPDSGLFPNFSWL